MIKWLKTLIQKWQCSWNIKHDLLEIPEEYPMSEAFACKLYEVRAEPAEDNKIRVFMPTCQRPWCGTKIAGFELRQRKWTVRPHVG